MPQQFANNPLGTPFIELKSIDSTNNYALEQVHAGLATHGFTVFAHEQLNGKGQRGKSWLSEKSSNVILSIVLDPFPLPISQQFQLIATTAVSVLEVLTHIVGEDAKIKWPNDLYWQDRKAGGILIETVIGKRSQNQETRPENLPNQSFESASGDWKWAIVGIGVNVNQTGFPELLINPVSIKQITGKNFDCIELSKKICTHLDKNLTLLKKDGFENIYQAYLKALYKRGENVRLKKDNRAFEGIIKGVNHSGELIVQHSIEECFKFGEVELTTNNV